MHIYMYLALEELTVRRFNREIGEGFIEIRLKSIPRGKRMK